MLACVAMNESASKQRISGDTHPAEDGTDFGQHVSSDVHPAGAVAKRARSEDEPLHQDAKPQDQKDGSQVDQKVEPAHQDSEHDQNVIQSAPVKGPATPPCSQDSWIATPPCMKGPFKGGPISPTLSEADNEDDDKE